ncbi:MAG: c-type cytochrome [Mangrovicoccus sp.]
MSKLVNYLAPSVGGAVVVVGVAYLVADQLVADIPAPVRGTLTPSPAIAESAPEATDLVIQAAFSGDAAQSRQGGFGLGRAALPEEIASWDIDVRPDGQGLPEGKGDVWTGEEIFADNCAMCHGDFGEAVGRWPVLAGGQGTLTDDRPVKTIGSYWPYLSTVFDYVNRAMPFGNAQSLSPDEVYAITAYLLYLNDIVDDDFELSHENFTDIEMPNEANFFLDDRADAELAAFGAESCMENCKETVEITARAAIVDVTPEDAEARKAREAAAETKEAAPVEMAAAEPNAPAADGRSADPALIAAGEKVFKKCKACHQVGDGAQNKVGPVLNGVVGSPAGHVDGFKYSKALQDAAAGGLVWSEAELAAFLAKPKDYLKGTKMSFAGLRKDSDIAAIIAFLKSQGG